MTPLALPSAIGIVSATARELLDAHITERDITWIMRTAVIVEALKRASGNKSRAARMLGMNRRSLKLQIRELHLEPLIADVKIFMERQLDLFVVKKRPTGVPAITERRRRQAA